MEEEVEENRSWPQLALGERSRDGAGRETQCPAGEDGGENKGSGAWESKRERAKERVNKGRKVGGREGMRGACRWLGAADCGYFCGIVKPDATFMSTKNAEQYIQDSMIKVIKILI